MSDEDEVLPEPIAELEVANAQNVNDIIGSAMRLCEAYFAWAFEERELYRASRGDEVAKAFRKYVELVHPKEFALMKLAERGFSIPKLVIHEK